MDRQPTFPSTSAGQVSCMAETPPETADLLRAQSEENLEFLRRLHKHALEQLRKVGVSSSKARGARAMRRW